jgi:hypothetical protein
MHIAYKQRKKADYMFKKTKKIKAKRKITQDKKKQTRSNQMKIT